MATLRKRVPWLMVVLLILSLTGQAAAAFVMPCRGTTSCCCQPMAAGMTHETRPSCCETPPSQPCDIASDAHPTRVPFLTTVSVDRVGGYAPAGLAAPLTVSTSIISSFRYDDRHTSGRGDPPVYLLIQTILC
jgi:hypothetical protein